MSSEELSKRMALARDLPFHHYLGLKITKSDPEFAQIELCPSDNTVKSPSQKRSV